MIEFKSKKQSQVMTFLSKKHAKKYAKSSTKSNIFILLSNFYLTTL